MALSHTKRKETFNIFLILFFILEIIGDQGKSKYLGPVR